MDNVSYIPGKFAVAMMVGTNSWKRGVRSGGVVIACLWVDGCGYSVLLPDSFSVAPENPTRGRREREREKESLPAIF